MFEKRTDLAFEARELWKEKTGELTELRGVKARDEKKDGFDVTFVEILDEEGQKQLGKPVGTYVTIALEGLKRREEDSFNRAAGVIGKMLSDMLNLKTGESILVVGLGNSAITPDSIGPKTMENTMVTRHLVRKVPEHFGDFREVSAFIPGVLGTTGLESAEIVKGVADRMKPDKIIVVDALASRKMSRVCSTVQLADTGIVPGSGIGNSRAAFNQESLGVPVIAVGVPTVVDAATLAVDLTEQAGVKIKAEDLEPFGGSMIVTPNDIDASIRDLSKVIGYGINLALHQDLTIDDINMFLS